MDSTPPSLKPSSAVSITKLPVKRKTPSDSNPLTLYQTNPDPVADLLVSNQTEPIVPNLSDQSPALNLADPIPTATPDCSPKPPPFKFHRIWTEPDEIRFLQGLLDSASDGLVFPRDLQLFYDRFSASMCQPYTKSQLSEKLRRLRKKFRVISTRLSCGLDPMMLSPHDRALYELSQKLWSPGLSSPSPFLNNLNQGIGNGGKLKVDGSEMGIGIAKLGTLSPSLRSSKNPNQIEQKAAIDGVDGDGDIVGVGDDHNEGGRAFKMSEMSLGDSDFGAKIANLHGSNCGIRLDGLAAKTVLDVFDQYLKEFSVALSSKGLTYPLNESGDSVSLAFDSKDVYFERRWQQQRALELHALARRLRLVLEISLDRK